MRAFEFEDIVADLFRQMGYDVQSEARLDRRWVDLLVERDGRIKPIEVSAPSQRHAMAKLRADALRLQDLNRDGLEPPLLVIAAELTEKALAWSKQQFDLQVWDLDTLYEQSSQFPSIIERLNKLFPDRHDHEPETSKVNEDLQSKLCDHQRENTLTSTEYERLCRSVFQELFDPYLYGFEDQTRTTDAGNRYDFICRIQPGNAFWDSLRQDFRTKAILFECKNYEKKIGPDQVYSTERYLFSGALRTVCLLVSRLGPSDGAIRAAQGAMRETGKLIILLSNTDLIEMLKLNSQLGAAEDYLDKRIWDFIVSLPR